MTRESNTKRTHGPVAWRFTSCILAILLSGFATGVYGQSATAVTFQIRTTDKGITIDVPDAPSLERPRLELRIQNGDGVLWEGPMTLVADASGLRFSTGDLSPKLWSPVEPNLYNVTCTLFDKRKAIRRSEHRIGFRKMETRNGQIFLNDKPIFLRGIAINPPGRGIPPELETSRAFAQDYVRFMKSINVNIIRIPDDQNWYDVCDELGMMVFGGNYSGTVGGEKPPVDYDKGVNWYRNVKFAPIMHHPSLVIYALTNEVPYTGEIAQRWINFLSYAHRELRKWDDTRLYIGNAGYGYGQSGDICDLHRYWGWYYASPFTFLNIRDYERITFPDKVQPLTFTECVGNYTGPDGRYNLTPNHKNPVSQMNWTGHAPSEIQDKLADEHQSFVFKQATELMRRLRRINPESSGVFPFTIMFRNWHTIESFGDMDPKPVTGQARLSYQPILLSWEHWAAQQYAGSTLNPIAHVINDSDTFSDIRDVKLVVRLRDEAHTIHATDTLTLPDIRYYDIHSQRVSLRLPDYLFEGSYTLEGIVLSEGKEISRNFSPLFVARKNGSKAIASQPVKLFDNNGQTRSAFDANQIPYESIQSFERLKATDRVVIGENSANELLRGAAAGLRDFVAKGGRLLILRQDSLRDAFLKDVLPVEVQFPRMNVDDPSYPPPPRPSRNGYNVNPERPDHPVFSGIERTELRVWSDYTGWDETRPGYPAIYPVTDGFVLANKADVETTAVLANYSGGLEAIALAEIFDGKGSVLLCGFDIARRAGIDPVSDRLLQNMLRYTTSDNGHENHIRVTAPIRWGDYESEKGILTGVYSGLMLNSKPALFGSYEDLPISVEKDGHMYAGAKWGWNNRAGKQYVPYGRRMFGPYYHRDFGGVPAPLDSKSERGEGMFWCTVAPQTKLMETLVWNPADTELAVEIEINDVKVRGGAIAPGAFTVIESELPGGAENLKVLLRGDRRLVILQTTFR